MRRRTRKQRAAVLRAEGWALSETAKEVGVRESQIREWEHGDDDYWDTFFETHARIFYATYAQAMAVMRQEMRSEESLARWRAADSILRHFASIRPGGEFSLNLDDLDDLIEEPMDEPFDEEGEER